MQTREIATSECECCRKPGDCENEKLETEPTAISGYYEMWEPENVKIAQKCKVLKM